MRTRGTDTRARIVSDAAQIFNVRGFAGTSMRDLLTATGLQKGGLYNHFGSKEQLAIEAFDYAAGLITTRFERALKRRKGAVDRLLTIVDVLRSFIEEAALPGGCPVLNTAIEADDVHPALRERAQQVMTDWQKLIGKTVKNGVKSGELRPDAEPRTVATIMTATLEGAVMLSKLYGDPVHLHRAADHVSGYVRSLAAATPSQEATQ